MSEGANQSLEERVLRWREEFAPAAFELAKLCGLITIDASRDMCIQETPPEERSVERVNLVFGALRTLIEIDPAQRR